MVINNHQSFQVSYFPFPKWPKQFNTHRSAQLRASRSAWRCESAAAAPRSRRRRQWRWSRRKPLQIRWDLVQLWQLISCNLLFFIPQKKKSQIPLWIGEDSCFDLFGGYYNWLVVDLPLWKILVSWDDYSQYMEKQKSCSIPRTTISYNLLFLGLYISINGVL